MSDVLYPLKGKRIYVAGHRGMVGSAIVRRLAGEGCEVLTTTRAQVDLTNQAQVQAWFAAQKPDAVFLAAAKVGGILANDTEPAAFLYENLMIEANIIHAAHLNDTQKLCFLGSSCIYPKLAPQPIPEEALLEGPLEPTNEWYAIAKIAGIKMCQAYRKQYGRDFISAMPTNLYGTGDNYHPTASHVLPALIRRADEAVKAGDSDYTIWGTGTPLREFMHADDCADALVFLMQHYSDGPHVNVGSGQEISILDLARTVLRLTGFQGQIHHDLTKPDGTPRKLMDSTKLHAMGWSAQIPLEQGIKRTLQEFRALGETLRG
jgi:GDP-L-fucose synthase